MKLVEFRDNPSGLREHSHKIDIVCSAYDRPGQLRVLIQCLLNQEDSNWNLHVIHDGPSASFSHLARTYHNDKPQCKFSSSQERSNDYGHSLRAKGLEQTTADYVLITNDDNYYPPSFLSYVNSAIHSVNPDVILYDMVHGHSFPGGRYQLSNCLFQVYFARESIDIGAAVVRGSLAREAGFHGRDFSADATYFEDIKRAAGPDMLIVKIPRILLYHN